MNWQIKFIPEAKKDFDALDGSNKPIVRKAIAKIAKNPVSIYEGGYGHPLSNLSKTKLAGYFKVKLRAAGIRIVYKLIRQGDNIVIVVIGARADNEVYEIADKRIKKYNL